MRYEKFILDKLFIIEGTKSLDAGKLTFIDNGINFVGRINENNGVQGKIEKQNFEPNNANTITATVIGNYKYVKYQQEPYYCSQNINKLTPRFEIDEMLALYFCTVINKFVSLYNGQQGGYKLNQLKEFICKLPIKTDENNNPIIDNTYFYHDEGFVPDFECMKNYIDKVEKEHINELEKEYTNELANYLTVTGFNNYELTEEDKKILTKKIIFIEKKIEDLFDIESSKHIFHANNIIVYDKKTSNTYPYIVRSALNNGLKGYIEAKQDEINKGNTLSFAQDTFTVFYQPYDYTTGNKVKILVPKYKKFNERIANYIITSLNKTLQNFTWGTGSDVNKIKSFKLELPSTDGINIDFEYMEKYIKAIEKLAIKDVVLFKDKVIKETKNIVFEEDNDN